MTVRSEEQEPRFPPPDHSPDRGDKEEGRAMDKGEEEVREEAFLDPDRVEDTVVSGFSLTFIHCNVTVFCQMCGPASVSM